MTARTRRRLIGSAIVAIVLVVIGLWLPGWLEGQVLRRSEALVARAAGPESRIRIDKVDLDLWRGDVQWTGVDIEQPISAERPPAPGQRSSGTVEKVDVRGLSYWQLLVKGKLSMRSLRITRPHILLESSSDTLASAGAAAKEQSLSAFQSDTLIVDGGAFSMRKAATDTTTLSVDRIDIEVIGTKVQKIQGSPLDVSIASASGQIRGISATLPPLQILHVDGVELSGNGTSLRITGTTLRPVKGPQDYQQMVKEESDLYDLRMDTAVLDGLDLGTLLSTRSLTASAARIAGVTADVFRDKTLPDNAYKHKRLPARMLRELPFKLRTDSVILDRWNVQYHEKNTLSSEYGAVSFADIHAVATGVSNLDTAGSDTLVITATARAYDRTQVHLLLRTAIMDPSDRFIVNATIGALPIGIFNRMTSDLVLARATAGTIGGVDLTMNATDERATGRVDMEYDNLELELLKQDGSGERRKFMSGLLNQVVHQRNLRSDPGFRHGDFDFERRKDRSFFNYLWTGLREGMITTALPGLLDDVRQIDQANKTEKHNEGK
ncbi:MAG: hypothetical protein ABI599_11700 [Flavobacteriales bacterium]